MLIDMTGDIFTTNAELVAHGVNCRGTMGAGLAKQIATRFPEVLSDYRDLCVAAANPQNLLGKVQTVSIHPSRSQTLRGILNCFTQVNYGRDRRHTDYDAVSACFKQIAEIVTQNCQAPAAEDAGHAALALPRIGAGLGGGDWGRILPIIKEHLDPLQHRIEIWTYA